jgi:flagellar basal body-associated protein FliL
MLPSERFKNRFNVKKIVIIAIIVIGMFTGSFTIYQHMQNQTEAERVKDDVQKVKKYIELQKRELNSIG